MAELYRRKESRFWWMAFVINHKTYRFSTGQENQREAKLVMDQRVANVMKGLSDVSRNSRGLTMGRPISGDEFEAPASHIQDSGLSQD